MAGVEFLNIDLDLESTEELILILDELGDDIVVMSNINEGGIHKLSFEVSKDLGKPELVLKEYISIINGLSSSALELFKRCKKVVFDIGFECEGDVAGTPIGITEHISSDTIKLLANINADVAITVYSVPS